MFPCPAIVRLTFLICINEAPILLAGFSEHLLKLSKISGVINRLKYVFPKQILINLYKSLFTPHLNYGSLVWGTNTKQIEILQKRTLRIITNSSYIAHTEPILNELGLINVKDMFSLKIINFFYINYLTICCHHIFNHINHFRKNCCPIFSSSSPFATATNLSCLRRIRYHLSVSSYEKYHFCKQQINYAENH